MTFKTPYLWRFLGILRSRIDNYNYFENILKKLQKQKIFFIQIGANDGISHDPIFPFSQKWDGILIEPVPSAYENLKRNYSGSSGNLIFKNIAVSDYDGKLCLYVPKDIIQSNEQSKIVSAIKNIVMLKNTELDEIEVPCITLNTLIEQQSIKKIDLLIIDVEGYETVILNSYNFSVKPAAIYIETRFYNYDTLVKLYSKFIQIGYRIFPEKDNTLMLLK